MEEVVIPPGERRDVGTGIALAIPAGYAGFVQPRSGLAFKHGIMVVNSPGLIDAGYRGEVRVSLYNSGTRALHGRRGGAHRPAGRSSGWRSRSSSPRTNCPRQQGRGGLRQQRALSEAGSLAVSWWSREPPRAPASAGYSGSVYSSQVFGTMFTLMVYCSLSC